MRTVGIPSRRLIIAAAAASVVGVTPMVAAFAGPTVNPVPRLVAQDECGSSDTEDSYSLQCVPTNVPDFNDQLTEAEVAEPGFNAGGEHGGSGHH